MKLAQNTSRHFHDVFFGGNWTVTHLKEVLSGVNWQQAAAKREGFNSILALAYHINYFVTAMRDVLEDKPLTAHDKFSFDHPVIASQQEWEDFLNALWSNAEITAKRIAQMPEEKFFQDFSDSKYGSYYRNINGIIEHTHYHMGQIVILKKMK